eukprot:1014313-Ditylum_brightwellii.AAC.1
MSCGTSEFEDELYGPEVYYQQSSCCSANGLYAVVTGQVGGFNSRMLTTADTDFNNDYNTTSTTKDTIPPKRHMDGTCAAFVESLAAVLCDPQQGHFIIDNHGTDYYHHKEKDPLTDNDVIKEGNSNNINNATNTSLSPSSSLSPSNANIPTTMSTSNKKSSRQNASLLLCQSSCNAVYDACGPPGINFPLDANYTDGTSLCYYLWNGFHKDNNSSPHNSSNCNIHQTSNHLCQTRLSLEITQKACLQFIPPSEEMIHYHTGEVEERPLNSECYYGDAEAAA